MHDTVQYCSLCSHRNLLRKGSKNIICIYLNPKQCLKQLCAVMKLSSDIVLSWEEKEDLGINRQGKLY